MIILVLTARRPHAQKNCDVMTTTLGSTRLAYFHTVEEYVKAGAHYTGNRNKEKEEGNKTLNVKLYPPQ